MEISNDDDDFFLEDFLESTFSHATISYTAIKVGDFVMFKNTFHIGKVMKFLKYRGLPDRYFILYAVPAATYPTISKHSVLEWTMFSKVTSEELFYIQDVSNVYSQITIFNWNTDNNVIVTSDAFSTVQ